MEPRMNANGREYLNLDPASTFKFFLRIKKNLPERVYLPNPASLNLVGYKVLAGFRLNQ
jgi:hypothetical protein